MKKRIALLLSLVAVISIFMPACSSKRDTDSLKIGTRVHNGMYNPLYAMTAEDKDVCNLVYEGLTQADLNGQIKVNDRLVESFATSSDKTVYTFVLKEGVQFANKKPMTTEDIIFTYQTLADKSSSGGNKDKIMLMKGAEAYSKGSTEEFLAVEAANDRTVMFNFIKDDPTNLEACGIKILSKAYYPDIEIGNTDIAMKQKMRTPLGSGPYVINDITSEGIVLYRNDAYWAAEDSNYLIDVIEIKYYEDTLLPEAFASGDVDMVPEVTNRDILMMLKTLGEVGSGDTLDFVLYDTDKYAYLSFNMRIWYSKSWTVRRAIGYAFNRDEFIQNYFSNYATRINTMVSNDSELYSKISPSIEPYNYDPVKARELLASVNYIWDEEGIMHFDGGPVTLTFHTDISNLTSEAIVEQFATDMAELGIEVKTEHFDSVGLATDLADTESKWNIIFTEDNWSADNKYKFMSRYTAGDNKTNVSGYKDATIDALALQLAFNNNMSKDLEDSIYGEVLKNVNTYLPELPIYNRKNAAVISSKVIGLEFNRHSSWTQSIEGASLRHKEATK